MSNQLAISAVFSIFAMAGFVLFGTPPGTASPFASDGASAASFVAGLPEMAPADALRFLIS